MIEPNENSQVHDSRTKQKNNEMHYNRHDNRTKEILKSFL